MANMRDPASDLVSEKENPPFMLTEAAGRNQRIPRAAADAFKARVHAFRANSRADNAQGDYAGSSTSGANTTLVLPCAPEATCTDPGLSEHPGGVPARTSNARIPRDVTQFTPPASLSQMWAQAIENGTDIQSHPERSWVC